MELLETKDAVIKIQEYPSIKQFPFDILDNIESRKITKWGKIELSTEYPVIASACDGNNKFSPGFYDCIGVVAYGRAAGKKDFISFLSHQNPREILKNIPFFQREFSSLCEYFYSLSSQDSIDVCIFGGKFVDPEKFALEGAEILKGVTRSEICKKLAFLDDQEILQEQIVNLAQKQNIRYLEPLGKWFCSNYIQSVEIIRSLVQENLHRKPQILPANPTRNPIDVFFENDTGILYIVRPKEAIDVFFDTSITQDIIGDQRKNMQQIWDTRFLTLE